MKNKKGLTIIQIMLALLFVGVVVQFVVDFIIEKRCETSSSSTLCAGRKE